nr:hypothetical protein [Paraburkholderia sp. BL8N3]
MSINWSAWRKAFWAVFWGQQKGPRKLLVITLVLTIWSPCMTYLQARRFQGVMPPNVPSVHLRGHVIFGNEQSGRNRYPIADFVTEGGRSIRLQDDRNTIPEVQAWQQQRPLELLSVEGFWLQDGEGLFWITSAGTADGDVILNQERRMKILKKKQNPFGELLMWLYLVVVVPLWLISFFIVRKVRISPKAA